MRKKVADPITGARKLKRYPYLPAVQNSRILSFSKYKGVTYLYLCKII